MLQDVRDRPKTWVQAAIRQWERVPIRVQARITIALPLVAVIISALLAISGNAQRVAIETDIQRKFEVSAALGGLSSLMVNAETGMRGYLLTGRTEFLEPFDQASRELAPAVASLRGLASAESEEGPRTDILGRLGDLEDTTARQMADLSFQRAAVSSGMAVTDPELLRHLEYGKQLMDRIRAEVGSMQAEERRLLDSRIDEINAIRVRDYVSVALALVAALATRFLAWFLFRRGILRRVDRLTDTLRDRRNGSPTPMDPPTKRDQMGQLEREVHLLDR